MNDIGWAKNALKEGCRVRRAGWNGKGMYLFLEKSPQPENEHAAKVLPAVWMFTAQGEYQPGWVCSQADFLAEDWELAT